MKKTLVVLVVQPLNSFNYNKWEFNRKYNKKWNIIFWNLLSIQNENLNKKFTTKGHGIIKAKNFININDYSNLLKQFKKLPPNFYYINLSILSFKCSIIDRILKIKGGKCIYLKMNVLPEVKISFKKAILLILKSSYKFFFLKKIIVYPFLKLINFFNHFIKGKPEIHIVPNQNAYENLKRKNKNNKIIRTYSYDYERFIQNRKLNKKNKKKKNYAVFIDQNKEDHFDHTLLFGEEYYMTSKWYWEKMEKFFSFIESNFKLKVIIAAHHRRSKYNLPIKRQFIFNKTINLVRDCKLAITHNSTAINQAILYKKPLILINFNVYKKRMSNYLAVLNFGKLIGSKVINLESFSFSKKIFNLKNCLIINKKKYKKYKEMYIKPKTIKNNTIWKTVLNELDRI